MDARRHDGPPAGSPESFLFGLRARGVRPGLEPTRAALDALGSPDRAMKIVQVAGSVGKGSTAAMVASILRGAGLDTALFTSPHLVRFGERFVVNGVEASPDEVARALDELREAVPWAAGEEHPPPVPEARPLTFFEWATILALHLFEKAAVDVAVLEVGLGGRWDATTACRADVTAIGRLDLEHTDLLGDTLEEIAFEKAGVLRPGVPAATVLQAPEALSVLKRRAAEVGAPLSVLERDIAVARSSDTIHFDYEGPRLSFAGLRSGLRGPHQVENAALALATVEALASRFPKLEGRILRAAREGLAGAVLPGRVEEASPGLWLDGSHTRLSIEALAREIRRSAGGRAHLVFAALKEKPAGALLEILRPVAESITLTSAGGDRAAEPRALVDLVSSWGVPWRVENDPRAALASARERGGGLPVVACGSFYLIGALRAAVAGSLPDPGDPSTKSSRSSASG